jgi:hypothetical protein
MLPKPEWAIINHSLPSRTPTPTHSLSLSPTFPRRAADDGDEYENLKFCQRNAHVQFLFSLQFSAFLLPFPLVRHLLSYRRNEHRTAQPS